MLPACRELTWDDRRLSARQVELKLLERLPKKCLVFRGAWADDAHAAVQTMALRCSSASICILSERLWPNGDCSGPPANTTNVTLNVCMRSSAGEYFENLCCNKSDLNEAEALRWPRHHRRRSVHSTTAGILAGQGCHSLGVSASSTPPAMRCARHTVCI
jgi:hypothetical protein